MTTWLPVIYQGFLVYRTWLSNRQKFLARSVTYFLTFITHVDDSRGSKAFSGVRDFVFCVSLCGSVSIVRRFDQSEDSTKTKTGPSPNPDPNRYRRPSDYRTFGLSSRHRLCMSVFVRTIKPKRLKLKSPNLAQGQSIMSTRPSVNIIKRSKVKVRGSQSAKMRSSGRPEICTLSSAQPLVYCALSL